MAGATLAFYVVVAVAVAAVACVCFREFPLFQVVWKMCHFVNCYSVCKVFQEICIKKYFEGRISCAAVLRPLVVQWKAACSLPNRFLVQNEICCLLPCRFSFVK